MKTKAIELRKTKYSVAELERILKSGTKENKEYNRWHMMKYEEAKPNEDDCFDFLCIIRFLKSRK